MQPTTPSPTSSSDMLKRYGPIIAIVAVIAVVAVVAITRSGSSTTSTGTTTSTAGSSGTPGTGTGTVPSRPGVLSFAQAKAQGKETSIDWGERCDTSIGKLKYPSFFAGACFAPFTGDNGGETATGVTATSIKVVFYQAQEADPILNYITAAVKVDDTNQEVADTMKDWIDFYNHFYETYGRKVELVPFVATGSSADEVSARADAITIAQDIKPFAVFGGPILTPAFGNELAARQVLCISCGPGATYDYFEKASPYLWGLGILPEQGKSHVVEYISKQLKGGKAEYAGQDDLKTQPRKFGVIYLSNSDDSESAEKSFEKSLSDAGVPLEQSLSYKSPIDLQTDAPALIAKLKSAGVTSVLFNGDPVAPQPLTRAATAQEYFPEWVMTGSVLTDTSAFGRTYDQQQWAHAFGVSFAAARSAGSGSKALYRWYFGREAPSQTAAAVNVINPALFYAVIQGVGPKLTAQDFKDALFAADPTARAISQPSLSYGNKGIWPRPDYVGVDDATLVWWNPTISGKDEIERDGPGLYMYVDGGKRYLPGEWPAGENKVFKTDGSVSIYETVPPTEQVPTYPSPAGAK